MTENRAATSVEASALALFDRYADMAIAEREHSLSRLREADAPLHDMLAALLAADTAQLPLLGQSPLTLLAQHTTQEPTHSPQPSHVGERFGAWQAVGVLGQGGMGVVYAAERSDGQHRQSAALKHIRAGLSSPRTINAFLNERDHLASLSHPGIVPLLDSGVDDAGQPWFVMQRVDGEPIDAWCDRRQLPLRERIVLFLEACDAVAFAHAHGVLHQDIKPSNLLVTPEGRTQLLDFGLSIATQTESREGRGIAMSHHYTAPEILRGGRPTYPSDIHSLGVLLYRLLCGQFPTLLDAKVTLPGIDPSMPERPSHLALRCSRQAAAQRGMANSRALVRKLFGDLDAIALACVAPDPLQRYGSVTLLQQDLRRWLESRPVTVRGRSWHYLAGCFVRRHRMAAALAGCMCGAIIAIAGTWAWQGWHAQRDMATASQVDRLFEQTLGIATLSGLGDIPLTPTRLLDLSEHQLRGLSSSGHEDVLARGLSVLARNWAVLGDYRKAETLAQEARALAPDDALQYAFNQATLAQIQNLKAEYLQAENSVRDGLSGLPFKFTEQHRLAWVRLQTQLAIAQAGQGHSRDAFRTLNAALAEAERLEPFVGRPVIAQLLIQRGSWYRNRQYMKASEADLTRAISLTETSDPIIADDARESLVRTVRNARRPGRETRALVLAEQLLRSRQHTLGKQHPQTGSAWAELAFVQMLNKQDDFAQTSIRHADEILKQSLDARHPARARVYVAQANLDTLQGRPQTGMEWARKAYDIYLERYGPTHELTLETQFLLASQYWGLYNATGEKIAQAKALELIGEGIGTSVKAHGDVPAIHRIAYATLLANAGQPQRARREFDRARVATARQYGPESQEMLGLRLSEASLLIDDPNASSQPGLALDSLIADAGKIDTLYAQAVLYSAWQEKARWLQNQDRISEARAAQLQTIAAAERTGQPAWIAKAHQKLEEFDRAGRSSK